MEKNGAPEMAVYGMAAEDQNGGCQLWLLGPTSDATQTVACLRDICRWSPLPVGPVHLCLAAEIDVPLKKGPQWSFPSSRVMGSFKFFYLVYLKARL